MLILSGGLASGKTFNLIQMARHYLALGKRVAFVYPQKSAHWLGKVAQDDAPGVEVFSLDDAPGALVGAAFDVVLIDSSYRWQEGNDLAVKMESRGAIVVHATEADAIEAWDTPNAQVVQLWKPR